MSISKKTKWVATDGWRGYVEPINAVAGANDTGTWSDSPCRSEVAQAELGEFKLRLQEAGIKYEEMTTESSNVFCVHHYVLTAPKDHAKAKEIAKKLQAETHLLYAV